MNKSASLKYLSFSVADIIRSIVNLGLLEPGEEILQKSWDSLSIGPFSWARNDSLLGHWASDFHWLRPKCPKLPERSSASLRSSASQLTGPVLKWLHGFKHRWHYRMGWQSPPLCASTTDRPFSLMPVVLPQQLSYGPFSFCYSCLHRNLYNFPLGLSSITC